jgi:hypothetical protein
MVEYNCVHCGFSRNVDSKYTGKNARCPNCKNTNIIGNLPVYKIDNLMLDKCSCGEYLLFDIKYNNKVGLCAKCSSEHSLSGSPLNNSIKLKNGTSKNFFQKFIYFFYNICSSLFLLAKDIVKFCKYIYNAGPDDKESYFIKKNFIDLYKYWMPASIALGVFFIFLKTSFYGIFWGVFFGLLLGILMTIYKNNKLNSKAIKSFRNGCIKHQKYWKIYYYVSSLSMIINSTFFSIFNVIAVSLKSIVKKIAIVPRNIYGALEKSQERRRHIINEHNAKKSFVQDSISYNHADKEQNIDSVNEKKSSFHSESHDERLSSTTENIVPDSSSANSNSKTNDNNYYDMNQNEDIYRHFVKENADYYLQKFKMFNRRDSFISWNWPAFLFTFFWLAYRRMYLYCALSIFLNIITGFTINLILWILFGLFGNYIYYSYSKTKINQAFDVYKDKNLVYKKISDSVIGGVSVGAVINLFVIFAFIIFIFFSAIISFLALFISI